jgi:protein arginine kinase activator
MHQQCDHCDKPAVVHETVIRNGVKREVHLCEEHAQSKGITLPGPQPLNQLLTQFVISPGSKTSQTKKDQPRCPTCDMRLANFRQSGTVGCPDCYESFDEQLSPLIERAQNSATHHAGKTPRRAGTTIDRQILMQRLVRELDSAIAAEQYERAAELRDQLKTLESSVTAKGAVDDDLIT